MRRIVIKIGSSVICPQGELNRRFLRNLSLQVEALLNEGFKIVLVSSGAIALGRKHFASLTQRLPLANLQAAASLGQIKLMDVYNRTFGKLGIDCAQLLLTWEDFQDRRRYINITNTLNVLFKKNILAIANENDVVATDEIKFGDNDRLSALLAGLISANKLIILSDVKGFLKSGRLLSRIDNIDAELMKFAKGSSSTLTKGGMRSKLEAAKIATASGIRTFIVEGKKKDIILKIARGQEFEGTLFMPQACLPARKRWIAFARKACGSLYIDNGAAKAIIEGKKSLLAVGVKKVEGDFSDGDSVAIKDLKGTLLGYGLASFSSSQLRENLGKKMKKEVIHRDNLTIIKC